MTEEAMKLALKRAFQYGTDYWYQADHDSYKENKKADKTLAEFHQFVEKTCTALADPPAPRIVDCHATGVCVQSGLRAEEPAQQELCGWKFDDMSRERW